MAESKGTNKQSKASEYGRSFVYILAAVLILLLMGNVLSKYVYKNSGQTTVGAHEFYFSSNYLTEDGAVYNLAPNTDKITVTLSNHEDNLRVSSTDIEYTVSVNGAQVKSGSLAADAKNSADMDIAVSSGNTYEVVAVGNGGFKKTIKATFNVLPINRTLYKSIEQTDEYVVLTVWAEELSGDVKVTFPETLLPDNTSDVMKDVLSSSGSFTDKVSFKNAYSSQRYRFFKTSAANRYTDDSFKVECGSVTAAVKVPEK